MKKMLVVFSLILALLLVLPTGTAHAANIVDNGTCGSRKAIR